MIVKRELNAFLHHKGQSSLRFEPVLFPNATTHNKLSHSKAAER